MKLTKILKVKGDWQDVVDDCRASVGKPPLGQEPSWKFKRAVLVSEHSPIRNIAIRWIWWLPYWVAMHWKTHIWYSVVKSQRNDRQDDYDRTKAPQDAPVSLTGDANVQHLIDTMRKRLCFQASTDTRLHAEDLKETIMEEVDEHIGWVMVPNCIYRGGCPEMNCCGFYQNLRIQDPDVGSHDIHKRYDAYNKAFKARKATREGK